MVDTWARSGADQLGDFPDAVVALYLTNETGPACETGGYGISSFRALNSDGILAEKNGLRVTFGRNASVKHPHQLLTFGSDQRCNVILKTSEASPVHCKVFAQLNSGPEVWVIEDTSAHGTEYKDEESSRAQIFKTLVRRSAATYGLHRIRIGPNNFHLWLPSDEHEKFQRERWFQHLDPILVTEGLLQEQLCGATKAFCKIRPIGQGGMADMFQYMERTTGLMIAVKEQRIEEEGADERIQKEIWYMQNLKHTNLVEYIMSESTINVGVKMWFTAMPLYQGRLCDLLPLDISAIEEVMLQLFNGVEYMHRNGVLHKDIKPANILVKGKSRSDIVLADYGICASLDNLNQLVDPVGTSGFAAPEVSRMVVQTTAVDVFALGATLFPILEPGRCHGPSATVATLGTVMQHPPKIYGGLVQSMMSPDPEERPTLEACFNIVYAKNRNRKERIPLL